MVLCLMNKDYNAVFLNNLDNLNLLLTTVDNFGLFIVSRL